MILVSAAGHTLHTTKFTFCHWKEKIPKVGTIYPEFTGVRTISLKHFLWVHHRSHFFEKVWNIAKPGNQFYLKYFWLKFIKVPPLVSEVNSMCLNELLIQGLNYRIIHPCFYNLIRIQFYIGERTSLALWINVPGDITWKINTQHFWCFLSSLLEYFIFFDQCKMWTCGCDSQCKLCTLTPGWTTSTTFQKNWYSPEKAINDFYSSEIQDNRPVCTLFTNCSSQKTFRTFIFHYDTDSDMFEDLLQPF